MDTSIKATTNWILTAGDIAKAIQIEAASDDIFVKPTLDEILSDERAILLNPPIGDKSFNNSCEFTIQVFPRYKIESLSMVCSSSKVELFAGTEKEYMETIHGDFITDETDIGDENKIVHLISYRYDIEINKSGVTEIMMKLLGSSQEVCIFGIILNVAPNPNGITTLLPNTINLENVQRMLQNSNIQMSANAEKCKMFMQIYKSNQNSVNSEEIRQIENKWNNVGATNTERSEIKNASTMQSPHTSQSSLLELKLYIDTRFLELETKILAKLDEYNASHSSKLNKILNFLEKT